MSVHRWIAGGLLLALLVSGWIVVARGAARAQEAPAAAAQVTIQQCLEDMEYLRVINRINPTPEQLAKLSEIAAACDLQRKQAETTRSQPAPQPLLDARASLLKGESVPGRDDREVLGEEVGQQMALANQAFYQARQQAGEQVKAVITEQQVRAFARGEGPLRQVDQLMAELGVSRSLPDDQWIQWEQRVVPGMVEMIVRRDPKAAKAPFEVASRFLEDARALSDDEFNAQKDALTQKLEQTILPADFRTDVVPPEVANSLVWLLLERPRSAALLQEAAKARQGG